MALLAEALIMIPGWEQATGPEPFWLVKVPRESTGHRSPGTA